MEHRPEFSKITSYQEFSKYYWYREELILICKQLGISSRGMKTELCHNIEEYFSGNKILETKPLHKSKSVVTELTPDTKLLECGFSFGPKFREFFSQTTGIQNFKFTVDMVATVKKVKTDNDTEFTLGDLLDIWNGKKVYARYDKSACQWNKFLKDFCADSQNDRFPNKLKTAAFLWSKVRNSTREKVYKPELINEFFPEENK